MMISPFSIKDNLMVAGFVLDESERKGITTKGSAAPSEYLLHSDRENAAPPHSSWETKSERVQPKPLRWLTTSSRSERRKPL